MFLEKFSRYIRRYELILGARKPTAPVLPLIANDGKYSVLDAIQEKLRNDRARLIQSNGDIVELIRVEHREADDVLVLLFHRASPNAADPTYRKKKAGRVSVRVADKDDDEEQLRFQLQVQRLI